MSIYTRIYDRKVRQQKQADARRAAERNDLFASACKELKRSSLDIDKMSIEKQIQLLEDYVERLDYELADFRAMYPNSKRRNDAVIIQRAMANALAEIENLRVLRAKGER